MILNRFARRPERRAFKRRGRIVLTLLAVLFLVGIVPVATMSWHLIGYNRETLTTDQQEIQLLLATSMAHEVDLHVEGIRSELLRVAQTLGAVGPRRGKMPREEIRQVLTRVAGARVSYVRYSYFEEQGVRLVSAGKPPEDLEPMFAATLQRVASDHARRAGSDEEVETVFSDPFMPRGPEGESVIVVAAPVVARGSLRGVLTSLVNLDTVWGAIMKRNFTGHQIFAVDALGNVFASSDVELIRPGRNLAATPLVQRLLTSQARGSTPFEMEIKGQSRRFIGAFDRTGQDWGIVVQAPAEEIFWTVHAMERSTISWMIALVGVAGLAAIFLARNLSNPINRLAAASRELAAGDLSVRVNVGSRDEIGELGHAFNSMASEIQSYVQRLQKAFDENNELFLGTIRALAQAIDAKDPYTRGHSVRVNRYSVIIARQLGLPEEDTRNIHVSSLMHDVGKIGIDDAILRKDGRLTDEEFEIIKTHPVLGAAIMAPIHQMADMIPGLRYHHERCDGSGYPDGLTREETPLMARIIAVADTFDAITTNRPYQKKMTFDQAVARINELKGHALDAEIVEAFNRACLAGRIRLEHNQESERIAIPAPPSTLGRSADDADLPLADEVSVAGEPAS